MSKYIKVSQELLDEVKKEFEESLKKLKASDGKIKYEKALGSIKRRATLQFSEMAFLKMRALVQSFSDEVAWHGIAKRGDDDLYIIEDILCYPQTVTGATVQTDDKPYGEWFIEQDIDNIRMQGHSHVNMSTSPSCTDLANQREYLDQLGPDMFYIFLIWNKRDEKNIKIYDLAKNILFETEDVDVVVDKAENGILKFIDEAKAMVKTRTYSTYKASGTSSAPKAPAETEQPKKFVEVKEPAKPQTPVPANSSTKKNKKHRYKPERDEYFMDDDDDPDSAFGYSGPYYHGGYSDYRRSYS